MGYKMLIHAAFRQLLLVVFFALVKQDTCANRIIKQIGCRMRHCENKLKRFDCLLRELWFS
jgi:hypothetical protein